MACFTSSSSEALGELEANTKSLAISARHEEDSYFHPCPSFLCASKINDYRCTYFNHSFKYSYTLKFFVYFRVKS